MGVFDKLKYASKIDYSDHLEDKSPQEIANWYKRMADKIEKIVGKDKSLAANFLKYYLSGKGKNGKALQSDINQVIKNTTMKNKILNYLKKYHRPVFLTERKVEYDKKSFWGGIVPRIKGDTKAEKDENGHYKMLYQGKQFIELVSLTQFVEILKKYEHLDLDATKMHNQMSDHDKSMLDIFTSYHACAIESQVKVSVKTAGIDIDKNTKAQLNLDDSKYIVAFEQWETYLVDEYDWNSSLGFPVMNPDYKSKEPDAIAPQSIVIVVHHKNAVRLEKAGLAHTFDIKSTKWNIKDQQLVKAKEINVK